MHLFHRPLSLPSFSPRHVLLLAGLAVGVLASSARLSADVVYFAFDVPGDAALKQRVTAPGVVSTPLILNNVTRNSINYTGDTAVSLTPSRLVTTGYSVARTLEAETYVSLRVTVAENQVLNLTKLEFQATAGGEGTRAFHVFSDATGFKAGKELLTDGRNGGLPIGAPLKNYSIPLDSLPALQGLRGGQSVEFRIYIQTSSGSINFDDLRLSGKITSA